MKNKKIKQINALNVRSESEGNDLIIKVQIGLVRFNKAFAGFHTLTPEKKKKILKDAMAQLGLSISVHFGLFDPDTLPKTKFGFFK